MASTYEDLISRYTERGYAPYKKLYYKPGKSLSYTVDSIARNIEDILIDLKRARYPIEEFVIGKTYARISKKKAFDPKNFKTWKLAGGVNGRWKTTHEPQGFDGLIALCALTRESLPSEENDTDEEDTNEEDTDEKDDTSNGQYMDTNKEETNEDDEEGPLYNHQDYAVAVKQQLIHHFVFKKRDARLANTSLSTGKFDRKDAKAYVIYMAYKIEREE